MMSREPASSSAVSDHLDRLPGPRDLPGLHRDVLTLLRRYPLIFVVVPAVVFFPFDLLNELVSYSQTEDALKSLRNYNRIGRWIELIVGAFVASTLLEAVRQIADGKTPTVGGALVAGLAAWGRVLKTTFITGLFVGLLTLLFIIPGLIFGTRWMLAVPATAIDGLDSAAARKRSAELVQERGTLRLFLWAFSASLCWYVISIVFSFVITMSVPLEGMAGHVVAALATMMANVVGAGIIVAAALIYFELSGRNAVWPVGLDLVTPAGERIVGPRTSGQVGLIVASVVGGLSLLVTAPILALGVWALANPEEAEEFLMEHPAMLEAMDSMLGDEP